MEIQRLSAVLRLSLMGIVLLPQLFVFPAQASAEVFMGGSFSFSAPSGTITVSKINIPIETQPANTIVDSEDITYQSHQSQPPQSTTSDITATGTQSTTVRVNRSEIMYGNVSGGVVYINQSPVASDNTVSNSTPVANPEANASRSNSVSNTVPDNTANVPAPAAPIQNQESSRATNPIATKPEPAVKSNLSGLNLITTPQIQNTAGTPPIAVAKTTGLVINPKEATYVSSLKELQSLKPWQTWKDPNTNRIYKLQAKTAVAANAIKTKLNNGVKTLNAAKPATP